MNMDEPIHLLCLVPYCDFMDQLKPEDIHLNFYMCCILAESEGVNGDVKVGESCKNNACKAVSISCY